MSGVCSADAGCDGAYMEVEEVGVFAGGKEACCNGVVGILDVGGCEAERRVEDGRRAERRETAEWGRGGTASGRCGG